MSGGTRIIPIDGAEQDAGHAEAYADTVFDGEAAASWDVEDDVIEHQQRKDRSWILPSLAATMIAGWTGFFAWSVILPSDSKYVPEQWVPWISQWAVPVVLVLLALLLMMRTSKREAGRFVEVSLSLARESADLEKRLLSINTELSLARDFIAAQSRDLESLGRIAVDRLSGSAAKLEELFTFNRQRVDQISDVSASALENMEKLRGQLPVIANSAKDVTNSIGNAGRTAHLQLEEMVSGFQRLNDFGLASERQVTTVRERVQASLDQFARASEDLAKVAEGRFEAISAQSTDHAAAMARTEQAALVAWRERTDAHAATLRATLAQLGEEHEALLTASAERLAQFEETATSVTAMLEGQARDLDEHLADRRAATEVAAAEQQSALDQRLDAIDSAIAQRRSVMEQATTEATGALVARLAEVDQTIEAQRKKQVAEIAKLANTCDEISNKVNSLSVALRSSGEEGGKAVGAVEKSIADINAMLADMRRAVAGTDSQIETLTDSAVRLLEIIQAGSDHTRTQMPEALRSTEAGLQGLENRVFTLRDTLREAGDGGRLLSETVGGVQGKVSKTLKDLQNAQSSLAEARQDSAALSEQIEQRLSGAIASLSDAMGKTSTDLRVNTAAEIEALAEHLGEESSAAISRVLQGRAAELVGRLEQAIDAAASSSRETAIQMRDQLTLVDELAGNLEARVSRARERAEEQVDNDFARRAALITDSLNSTSIDIAKALSSDVSETSWASYLRGDRGIFTRRAVTLLDTAEAKTVQAHYEAESEFREHVNRYIHDFEAMLRQLLSTRDGNALGVTLLSSDMGKLYIALAQGIERLRT
ncbi:hypothetical protein [Novosphingobium sp. AAP83]|uniref:hypothetical protein n=1 Tax=Novosphingobium sp. AAP83 TaxID=1523425 RepID=UPI0006BA0CC0|nr:hypothetical protein [Novosphingobium sp. AAP83]